ncbi:hypothetical protein [Sphingomonas sp. MMS24-J13]|uniref:hypothetical protein n=1 Tax=Sphingomonas sp. MMS24-J13 TaxID=3238686 RepID=UPI0038503658
MAARYLIGLALMAATVALAEEPTFITKHGKVIPAPGESTNTKRARPAHVTKAHGGRQCIPIKSIKAESAETSASLIFHANDGSAYRNRLDAPCDGVMDVNNLGELGLKPKDGKQLCAGDAVWMQRSGVQSALGMGKDGEQETCKLGTFEKISEMSLSEFLRR